jgi:hypothetical protein
VVEVQQGLSQANQQINAGVADLLPVQAVVRPADERLGLRVYVVQVSADPFPVPFLCADFRPQVGDTLGGRPLGLVVLAFCLDVGLALPIELSILTRCSQAVLKPASRAAMSGVVGAVVGPLQATTPRRGTDSSSRRVEAMANPFQGLVFRQRLPLLNRSVTADQRQPLSQVTGRPSETGEASTCHSSQRFRVQTSRSVWALHRPDHPSALCHRC